MGGGVSKRSAAQGLQPTLGTTTALTIRLLESLAAKEDRVSLPILSNSERQRSDRQRSADEPRLALRREERGTV